MTRKLLSLLIVTLFVCSSFANIIYDGASTGETIQLRFSQDEYSLNSVESAGETYVTVLADGCEGITLEKGAPELPFTATALAVAKGTVPTLTIKNAIYEEVAVAQVLPSPGNVTRDVDIATRSREKGAVYGEDAWYPEVSAEMGSVYVTQGVSGIALRVYPFQYNGATGVLRILKSADIEVSVDGAPTLSRSVVNSASRRTVLKDRFINGEALLGNTRYTPVEAGDRMIVITPSKYESAIAPLVEWKNKKGIHTTVHIYGDEVSSGASGVQSFIKEMYNSENVSYVLLVGDWEDVPSIMKTLGSENVSCDPNFVLIEGGDMYPDAFIGRISASTTSHVTSYVNKVLKYEMTPEKGGDWYNKAVAIGSSEGTPKDYEWLDDSINTELSQYGYTSIDKIYQGKGGSTTDFSNYVNEGRGLVNFMGHGNNDGFGFSSGFWYGQSYINNLINGDMLPVIIPLACNLGQFKGRTCAAEAWTRNDNGGAIVIMASSPLMDWTPPQGSQVEQNRLMAKERHISVGATFYNGQMKMLDIYKTQGNKSLQSWNYFGDPSLVMYNKTPKVMSVTHNPNFTAGSENSLEVTGEEGAIVCIYSETNGILGTAEVKSGKATVTFTPEAETKLHVTVTAKNCIPYMGTIEAGSSDPFVTVTAPNGGEVISLEESFEITWSDNVDEKATVTLLKDGKESQEIANNLDGNSYVWNVTDVEEGNGYAVVVACGDVADTSDATFAIKASSWSKNLVSHTEWVSGHDDYKDAHASSVTMKQAVKDTMITAAFKIGKKDDAKKIYPWANVSATLGSALEGVTAVKIIYKADKKVSVTLDQEVLMDLGTSYMKELPATEGEWSEVVVQISEFKQPGWLGSNDATALDLAKVNALSIAPVDYDCDANLEVKLLKLADYSGEYVGNVIATALNAESSPIAIAGVSSGKLQLHIAQRGTYKLSLYTVAGRVLKSESFSLAKGVNQINLGSGYSSQMVLLSIEGMGAHFMQKVFVK